MVFADRIILAMAKQTSAIVIVLPMLVEMNTLAVSADRIILGAMKQT